MRREPGRTRTVVGLVIVALLALTVLLVLNRPEGADQAIDDGRAEDSTRVPTESASPSRRARDRPSDEESGAGGEGTLTSGPRHEMTMTLTSAAPLGNIAWIIPTDARNRTGQRFVEQRSWSLSTTVYGNPDYGVVGSQVNYLGTPITCEIRIDGRVTERRTATEPFSVMWCQG